MRMAVMHFTACNLCGVQQSAEGACFWKGEAEGKSKQVSCSKQEVFDLGNIKSEFLYFIPDPHPINIFLITKTLYLQDLFNINGGIKGINQYL